MAVELQSSQLCGCLVHAACCCRDSLTCCVGCLPRFVAGCSVLAAALILYTLILCASRVRDQGKCLMRAASTVVGCGHAAQNRPRS